MRSIAIFTDNLRVGGIQKSIVNILNNIDYKKYQVDLYLFDENHFYEINKNVNVITLEKPKSIYKFIPFKIVKKLLKVNILDKKYDVSIDFDSYQMHTAIGALNCNSNKKVIWIHNDIVIKLKEEIKYKILHLFFKNKYKEFDTYCAVSKGALDSFKELYNYENKDYKVIPNYIDTTEIKNKLKEETNINVDNNKINIVTVGRLCHQKGIDIMLDNISLLKQYRNDFHLYIIGDGPDKEKLLEQAKNLNLEDYITFLGNQSNPFKYMKKMDLFYLQSRYEGQGMVILEALSVGLDILIPKHLEKYCPDIIGVDSPLEYLKEYKNKKTNKFNDLQKYNNLIKEEWTNLLGK